MFGDRAYMWIQTHVLSSDDINEILAVDKRKFIHMGI